MYPGIIGNTHGVKKLINPALKAKANLMIIVTLYLPLNFTAITILAHDD
tara:strand:- start:378 stop:524 length:147 start_codon:yes stop_codon:yes gene_type:complete